MQPIKISLRMYQVGFGDCFLLTFHYGPEDKDDRHVLIDFGTTGKPDGAPQDLMLLIANDIEARCRGQLHAVVATHRHADHINGFATGSSHQPKSGDVIRNCKPELVIQPWTEDPQAPADGNLGYDQLNSGQSFLRALSSMHDIADSIHAAIERLGEGLAPDKIEHLKLLAANNRGQGDITNRSAVQNLMTMGKRAEYLSYYKPTDLASLLPGVKIHVLGPPTLDQTKEILKQRADDPDRFFLQSRKDPISQLRLADAAKSWELQARESRYLLHDQNGGPFPRATSCPSLELVPPHARWFIQRMESVRSEQIDHLLEMVRVMDTVLNNTSLILLFEVGDKKLLFPGDAQLENWSYALHHPHDGARNQGLLQGVNLYKVGHHGSRNATPRELWKLIGKDGVTSVMSTKAGKYGDVPREPLIKELRKFAFHTTEDLEWNNRSSGELRHADLTWDL